jgi:hypothetical protein
MKSIFKLPLQTLLVFAIFISSCTREENVSSIQNAKWLEGTWSGKTKNGLTFYEQWAVVNDTLMRNINYHFENGTDTVVGGQSSISVRDGKLFYTNFTSTGAETWRTTKFNSLEMVFENGGVNHAQKVSFFKADDNKWEASLYGKTDTLSYVLNRVK